MKKKYQLCDLCEQPVKVEGFSLVKPNGVKKFCCEGCLRIFQLLDPEQNSTPENLEKIS
ncbi:MAG: metal-binding protein [Methylomonas sp.]|jgi:hypothetical protein|nr:MAG: metal-binding protein [Methylomonas sp.]